MADHFVSTKTTLAQPLNTGDSIVYLNSVANYATSNGSYLGFYPFEDYPEYTYTRNTVNYNAINAGNNSLTLTSAYAGSSFPVGTKVAQQRQSTCGYMYSVLAPQIIPNA
jgi:hypothetical protein